MNEKEIEAPQLLSRTDAAKFIGVRYTTLALWAWKKSPALPFSRIGNKCFYDKKDLIQFIKNNKVKQDGWKEE